MSAGAACNPNIPFLECTLATCCRADSFLEYAPNLGATAAYLAIFAILLVFQVGLGLWYRTWGFCIGMTCGLILEVIGYAGRILLRSNPFSLNNFLLYFIPLGLGPAFMTASIYLTLARIVIIYGPNYSYLKPRTYTILFVTFDITSLVIQAVGGALTAESITSGAVSTGTDILIAGLSFQAGSLAIFIAMCALFAYNVRTGDKTARNPEFDAFRHTAKFKYFQWAIAISAISIFVRCIYRVVELSQGFAGALAQAEVPFLILEGPLIMLAIVVLTIAHPGLVFNHGVWQKANWVFRTSKAAAGPESDKQVDTSNEELSKQ